MTESASAAFRPSPWPLPEGGRRVLVSPEQLTTMATDERISALYPHGFGFYPQARGHRMARQQHDDHLVIYCVEGQGHCWLGEARYTVNAGDMLVLPAGTAHRYGAARQSPWSIFWLHLGGRAADQWLAPLCDPGPVAAVGLHERLVLDFRALLDSNRRGVRGDDLRLTATLCQSILAHAALMQARARDADSDSLAQLHSFMDAHLTERLTLDDLVSASGTPSRYQFIRLYKRITGQTPMQAFLQRKMAHACYLMDVSDDTVAAIGRQLGFDDPYYFSRAFKRVVGVSPAHYRRTGGQRL